MTLSFARLSVLLPFGALILATPAHAQGSDACRSPEPIAGLGEFRFSTLGATTDGTEAALCNAFGSGQIHNDVWFCWTATSGGLVSISTCGASFDTRLAVYAGCGACPDESGMIACNDDSCALQSKVDVAVRAGESYMIRVGAYSAADTGTGPLSVSSGFLAEITNPANGHVYAAVNAGSWTSASALAESLGGHLVAIGDEGEQEFVWSEFGNLLGVDRRVWIGFNDLASEGSFEWTSGDPARYTNWNDGEPNNAGNGEHVTELLGSSGRWNDLPDGGAGFPHIAVIEFGAGGGCVADVNRTGDVDSTDLAIILGAWGGDTPDLDGNGVVGASDLALILGAWGPC